MSDLKKQERAAIDAVARRFSATWQKGSAPHSAHIVVTGKRIAVDITTLKSRGTGRANAAKPGLRFDKVVIRLMERLRAALGDTVRDGVTVLLTITAPIRLAAKTAAALESRIQILLRRGTHSRDARATMYRNRVRIRLLPNGSARAPRMIGFVHNPDTDPLLLLNMTRDLLEALAAAARRHAASRAGERWLVVLSAEGIACLEAYRYIHSQLPVASRFKKILMVFADGRIGLLKE